MLGKWYRALILGETSMPKSKKLEGFAVIVNGQLFRGPTQADVISQIKAASVEVDRR